MEFLKALTRDLAMLTYLAAREFLEINIVNMDQPLPRDAAIIATNLSEVMQQCRRLKNCPALFPSLTSQSEFLQNVSRFLPIMAIIPELLAKKHELDSFRTLDIEVCDDPNEKRMPHPNLLNGKSPWNQWLDNCAEAPEGWIGIEQRIPRFGDMLIRRITLEYDAIEADFIEVRSTVCKKLPA